ncbi:hypothetical protein [Halococcoides cellulosivorans]|uniref:Nucleic acid-binding protein n=1 Tax=Halococcoides cellulosivorans TaxID=1679096 RepID=A0A2R4X2K9_9EURY|nr:hypothetical protein [Halococcoides cellulosivorans]AWB27953.1 hypothetical protein HARCEL1_09645 [Halococcoides cellulosivorans]
MTFAYVGPTVCYDLGQVGELDLLEHLDAAIVVPESVVEEITVEPARLNLDTFLDERSVITDVRSNPLDRAADALGLDRAGYEAALFSGLFDDDADDDIVVVSDDPRLRAIAAGLGAETIGSFGVVVGAAQADKYLTRAQAKRIVTRMDAVGLQMTGALRGRAVGEFSA